MYRTLEYLNGISDDDVKRLRAVGIRHTNQLLHRGSLAIDRERLEKKTGLSSDRLLEFVHQCTVLEVSGMDRWIPLMRRLGIVTMKEIATAALKLDPRKRAKLAARLIESLREEEEKLSPEE